MRNVLVAIVLSALATLAGHAPVAIAETACKDCPPAYCEDPSAAKRLKAAKKAQAEARGLPPRLSALYDQLPNCAACIEQAPDWPYVVWRYDVDAYEETYGIERSAKAQMAWSRNTEQQARNDMRSGLVIDYYVTLESKPCHCCSDATGGQRAWSSLSSGSQAQASGWNDELELVTTSALHVNQSTLGENDPQDLSTLPRTKAGQQPVPGEVDAFLPGKPLRVLQVSCPECQDRADAYNQQATKVNRARWDLATRQRDLAYERAMIQWRWNQDDRLGGLAYTDDTAAQLKANKAARDDGYRRVATLEKQIAKAQVALKTQEAALDAAMDAVRACDPERCMKPAATDATSPEETAVLISASAAGTETEAEGALDNASAPLTAEAELGRQTLQTNPAAPAPDATKCPKCDPLKREVDRLQKQHDDLLIDMESARKAVDRAREKHVRGLMDRTGLEQNHEPFARKLGGEALVQELREANAKVDVFKNAYRNLISQYNDASRKLQEAINRLDACLRSCAMATGEYSLVSTLGPFAGGSIEIADRLFGFEYDTEKRWVDIVTDCKACQPIADQYNSVMRSIVENREELRRLINSQQWRLKPSFKRTRLGEGADGKLSEYGLSTLFKYIFESDAIILSLRQWLETQEQLAKELAAQLQACEASCVEDQTGKTISIAGGIPAAQATRLPFDWRGPYTTDCWHCEKLAAELNRLPDLARERLITIASAEGELKYLRARKTFGSSIQMYELLSEGFTKNSTLDREIETLEAQQEKARTELAKITKQFNTVLQMLKDCENLPQCTAVYQDPVVELQQTFTRLGFNGFSIPDVIGLRSGVDVPQPPVTQPTQPPVTPPTQPPVTPPTQPPVTPPTQPPVTPPTQPPVMPPPPPPPPPLSVTVTGFFSFLHTVGPTICPTPAGTAQISSNNGNPLRVDMVSDSGAIASRLDQEVIGNNTPNPSIAAEFNCNSAQNGEFEGQVTATVTDTVTNESQTISVPAEGTVN